jgi:quaternary ammonium compound-resistance protein SugE
MNPWAILVLAGIFEVVWAIALKNSEGFTRPLWSAVVVAGTVASFWLLARAMTDLPAGTAYAVWVGIGAIGVAVLGVVFFNESATPLRLAGLGLIVAGIAALKLG